jgi:hypothetical protein
MTYGASKQANKIKYKTKQTKSNKNNKKTLKQFKNCKTILYCPISMMSPP